MLALYILVGVAIVIVTFVSLNFAGNQHLASYFISDLVIYSGPC